MALELSKLVFQVDTTQLDEAQNKIKQLGTAMTNVNVPAAKMAKETQVVAAATEASTEATKKNVSVLERQRNIYQFMLEGFSKGQAIVLAQAKATGILSDEMKELKDLQLSIRKIQGSEPFDKSMAGLTALTNRYAELKEATRLYSEGVSLTRDQTRELARDKFRLIETMKATGKSMEEIDVATRGLETEYISLANKVNSMVSVEKELERQLRDTGNATRALAKEDERINATLGTLEKNTDGVGRASERTASKVAIYSRNLRLAGITGDEAVKKLEAYRKKVIQVQAVEEKRNAERLSNALAPQISDVTVSLAGGMNPLTVLLQQGLQVRDLIGQSGVEVQNLQEVFRTAASKMITSIKGTAEAVGSLLIGTIKDAGLAVFNFLVSPFAIAKSAVMDFVNGTSTLESSLAKAGESFKALKNVGIFGTIAALATLAIAYKDIIQEEAALSKAITMTGAGMGLSKQEALAFAESMSEVGVSSTKAIEFLTALAGQSPRVMISMEKLTAVAAKLSKVAGVSFEDTAKMINDLGDRPTDTLLKFAQASGRVELSVLKQVAALEESGNTAEAARIAQEAWAKASEEQAAVVYDNMSPVEKVWLDIKSAISGTWEQVKEFAKSETVATVFRTAWQTIAVIAAEVWYVLKQTGKEIGGIAAQIVAVLTGDFKGAAAIGEEMRSDAKSAREEQDKLIASIMGVGKETKNTNEEYKRSSAELKANAEAAKKLEEQLKKKGKKTDAEKEAERIRKEAIRDLERIAKETNNATKEQEQYSKAQKLALDIFANEDFKKYPEDLKIRIAAALEAAHAEEMIAEAMKKEREYIDNVREAYVKLQADRDNAIFNYLEKLDEENRQLLEESKTLDLQASMIGKTSEEREKAIKIRKVELQLAKDLADIEKKDWMNDESGKKAAIDRALENARLKIKNINREIAIDAAFQWQTSLSDAIETALFEGGKAGSKKLRDLIVAELRKPIRVFIEAVIGGFVGNIFGMGSGSSSGGDGGLGASAGGIGSLSTIGKVYEMLSGGLNVATGAGQGLSNLMVKAVNQFGNSAMSTMALQFSSGMMSTGSMAAAKAALEGTGAQMGGLIVGSVLNGLSGYGISKALSGGYSAGNGINTIAGIASMIPGIGPIAGVVGGLVNRAFGRKAPVTTGQGITGTFSTSGADVSQYQDWFSKGGWFRKNKSGRNYSAVTSEFDKFLDQSLMQITATTKAYASILGLVPEAIDGVTQSINISLMNLSAEQQQAEIEKALGGFSDTLAMNLLGTWETSVSKVLKSGAELALEAMFLNSGLIGKDNMGVRNSNKMSIDRYKEIITKTWKPGDFVREGETAGQALARLATSLTTVNSVFDTLNQTLYGTSLVGADAASKLLDAFGGAENFSKLTTDYYQNFYTEQERIATTTRQLTTIFEKMGLTLPTTRDEFRQLVEAQNLYTDEGRATYAALLNLAPAFTTITSAVEEFTNSLIDEVRRLRGEITNASGERGLAYYKSQFTAANAAALAGDTTALEQLPELSKAIEEAVKLQATSAEDIIRIQAWLAQSLSNTSATLGNPVPAFADGGVHSGGARIVGENGPELEITGPSRIYNSNNTNDIFGTLNDKLSMLNENITGLRAEVRADVSFNAKTAKLLDRVIPEGDSINISGTIDGGQV